MKTASSPNYEAPRAVSLSNAQTGVGASCHPGSSAREDCENGGGARALRGCTVGSWVNARDRDHGLFR